MHEGPLGDPSVVDYAGEKVVDLGPRKITAQKEKTISPPPILGGLARVGGIAPVVAAVRRS